MEPIRVARTARVRPRIVRQAVHALGLQLRPRREGPADRGLLGRRVGRRSRSDFARDEGARGQRRPHPPAVRQVHGRPRTSRTTRRSTGSASCSSWPRRTRLYLDLTGLGCYHKKDVPAWYDKLAEKDRWDGQARFWEAVAGRCAEQPGRLLLRPDERAGRARRQAQGRRLARARRSAASTSSSSSRSTRPTGRGRTSPAQWIKHAGRRHPQGRPAAPDHGRPGGLEPGPAGADLGLRAGEDRGRPRLPLRPHLPGEGQGGRGARRRWRASRSASRW